MPGDSNRVLPVALPAAATAGAQESPVSFAPADGPDAACDLQINTGGPYEVTIDGGPITIFENGSVVEVPQGSSVHYLRQNRTIGSTAIGTNETCAIVPEADITPTQATDNSGSRGAFIAGAALGIVVVGAAWWFLIRSKPRKEHDEAAT